MTASQAGAPFSGQSADTAQQNRLEVADVSKTFGSARVLRDIGLQIAPGELHGLVGQNGCGKSTLVKILTGIYTPDPGGAITVDGRAALAARPPARGPRGRAVGRPPEPRSGRRPDASGRTSGSAATRPRAASPGGSTARPSARAVEPRSSPGSA